MGHRNALAVCKRWEFDRVEETKGWGLNDGALQCNQSDVSLSDALVQTRT